MSNPKTPKPAPATAPAARAPREEPVAAPPLPNRSGTTAPWVPGRYPRTWAQCTDEQLTAWGLTRPAGADFAYQAAAPVAPAQE